MHSVYTRALAGALALGLWAAAPAGAVPVAYDLEFAGGSIDGTGSFTIDTDGATTNPTYDFRAGDTFTASFDFGSIVITFTEQDEQIPTTVPFTGDDPTGLNYFGFLDEANGIDLGFITFISLSMGDADWELGYLTDDGNEITTRGTFALVDETPETPVPEPASALLFAAGLAALGWSRRRI